MLATYASLVRFSHTIFALPFALGSFWVASQGHPSLWHGVGILLCMVTARNSAMAYNRLLDAQIDAQNPRTQNRHIPAGILSPKQVKVFIAINGLLFVAGAAFFNTLTLIMAVPVWLILLSYSWWKRLSFACHWFLGFAIGLSPLGAWIAVRGEFALFPALLGLFLMLWIAGFDIIYSTQDELVDRQLGLHSVPARFGQKTALRIALANHVLMWAVGLALVYLASWHGVMLVALAMTAIILLYIHVFRSSNDLDHMNRDFFLANGAISVLWMLALFLWIYTGGQGYGY